MFIILVLRYYKCLSLNQSTDQLSTEDEEVQSMQSRRLKHWILICLNRRTELYFKNNNSLQEKRLQSPYIGLRLTIEEFLKILAHISFQTHYSESESSTFSLLYLFVDFIPVSGVAKVGDWLRLLVEMLN